MLGHGRAQSRRNGPAARIGESDDRLKLGIGHRPATWKLRHLG
jgi:hypothetical protein